MAPLPPWIAACLRWHYDHMRPAYNIMSKVWIVCRLHTAAASACILHCTLCEPGITGPTCEPSITEPTVILISGMPRDNGRLVKILCNDDSDETYLDESIGNNKQEYDSLFYIFQ